MHSDEVLLEFKNAESGWGGEKKKSAGLLLLQDEVLEFSGEVKDSGYVQKWDDKLRFCWTKRSVTQRESDHDLVWVCH